MSIREKRFNHEESKATKEENAIAKERKKCNREGAKPLS